MGGGELDLARLLADLNPILSPERFAFVPADGPVLGDGMFAIIREEEGLTAIRVSPTGEWARISLGVHSSLDAVGLTATFSSALAKAGISANVVAGMRHDHIFVQWDRREDALAALQRMRL
jgi:hypothetical protein